MSELHAALRRLPKVDTVLASADGQALLQDAPRWAVIEAVREQLAALRQAIFDGKSDAEPATDDAHLTLDFAQLRSVVQTKLQSSLRPVLNATGVVLHTNLGRAPLAESVLQRISTIAGGYCNLEYRLESGTRGSRQDHLDVLLSPLTGAEAHLCVNNNAAAVLLMLAGLCAGRQVVVSRGELVEIGGSFRVPEVMQASGALLREVGTTNRTHLRDYEAATCEATRAYLKVHRGNFAQVGFVAEVPLAQLAQASHERGLWCLYDLGSGALTAPPLPDATANDDENPQLQTDELGSAATVAEPTVAQAVAAGCDVVAFSCDKLLGGPQAGILCGRREVLEPLRRHPLLRALRPDKLTLAALIATLELYRDDKAAQIPTLRMLAEDETTLHQRAQRLSELCSAAGVATQVIKTRSAVGGGSMPLSQPLGYAVTLCIQDDRLARRTEQQLRTTEPPVIARIWRGRLLLDVRTVPESALPSLAQALAQAVQAAQSPP